jgi:glycogen debranching enzyme
MIDIEPHYLLGLRTLKFASLSTSDQKRLRSVAEFIVRRAQEASLITFNRVATPFRRQRADEYYEAGNWRDSRLAYLQVSPVIAPYDVNAVLYPQALRVIRDHASELGIDWRTVDQLITRWDKVEDWYRFTNPDGTSAKALALYDVTERFGLDPTFTQLRVNHTDEAYDLFYGKPTEKDVISFCKRLLSPQYFYTASGPLIVARGNGYTPAGYHGEVIWTKQTAYIVTGLKRQLAAEFSSDWATSTIHLMKQTLAAIATTSVAAFEQLKAIPELHIDVSGQPTWYTDQSLPEGQMNKVQLWSAAGARPIIRAAQEFKKLP